MNKKIYMIAGVIAFSITGAAIAQEMERERGQHRGMSMMSTMDTDGNGTIEKSEFEAMLTKRFSETDTNNDGITFEEYSNKAEADRAARAAKRSEMKEKRAQKKAEMADKRAERMGERMGERMKNRFDAMDADNDGVISGDEYNAAGQKMFDRMDRDDDGILNDRHRRGGKKQSHKGSKDN